MSEKSVQCGHAAIGKCTPARGCELRCEEWMPAPETAEPADVLLVQVDGKRVVCTGTGSVLRGGD